MVLSPCSLSAFSKLCVRWSGQDIDSWCFMYDHKPRSGGPRLRATQTYPAGFSKTVLKLHTKHIQDSL